LVKTGHRSWLGLVETKGATGRKRERATSC
jgi:hypothetical protein